MSEDKFDWTAFWASLTTRSAEATKAIGESAKKVGEKAYELTPEIPAVDEKAESDKGTLTKAIDLLADPIKDPYKAIWMVILFAFVLSPIIMAFGESWNAVRLTAAWTVITSFAILFIGLRPTNLAWSGILGGVVAFFMDRDKSQGVATGPYWLWRGVITIVFVHFMMGLVAVAWDLEHVPGGFLTVWFIGLGFLFWNLYFNAPEKWFIRVTLGMLLFCSVGIFWQSLDPHTATGDNWFDDDTGKPLVVGYYDADGDFVVDPRGRSARQCRNGCFYKGIPLVTPRPEDAPDTSNFGLNGIIDAVTGTEAERKAKAAAAANNIRNYRPPQTSTGAFVLGGNSVATAPVQEAIPAGVPIEMVNVPKCASSNKVWTEKVNIPAGWVVTPAWSENIATYQWRDSSTGKWTSVPPSSGDAIRACAKSAGYAGDTLVLTWTQ